MLTRFGHRRTVSQWCIDAVCYVCPARSTRFTMNKTASVISAYWHFCVNVSDCSTWRDKQCEGPIMAFSGHHRHCLSIMCVHACCAYLCLVFYNMILRLLRIVFSLCNCVYKFLSLFVLCIYMHQNNVCRYMWSLIAEFWVLSLDTFILGL